MFLHSICIVLITIAAVICCYYWFLAIVAFLSRKKEYYGATGQYNRFAIVIPAHNEETVIKNTLENCAKMEYPDDRYAVIVVADNCNDRTADIAKQNSAICLERFDTKSKGKGFALSWAFKQVLKGPYDAVIVLDADCTMDYNALRVFNHYLNKGKKVLQANDMASNPDDNPMSYAVAVGNLIENDLFYTPKSELCMAVFLRGTGTVFHRSILEKYPWDAHSIVEDMEYTLKLFRDKIKISFISDVTVKSIFPSDNKQFKVQRTRWASGLSIGKRQAIKIIKDGVLKKNRLLVDTGITLLVLSKPLVLMELFLSCIIALLTMWIYGDGFSLFLLIAAFVILSAQILYFLIGILKLGLSKKRLRFLFGIPIVVLRLIIVSISGFFGLKQNSWEKTPR